MSLVAEYSLVCTQRQCSVSEYMSEVQRVVMPVPGVLHKLGNHIKYNTFVSDRVAMFLTYIMAWRAVTQATAADLKVN